MTGNPLPGGIVMGIMFGVPLLLIFLKEPLTRMIEKRADKMETGPGMYIVQGFFEMFETLLSYFLKHSFLYPYRCICCQPCRYHGSCTSCWPALKAEIRTGSE